MSATSRRGGLASAGSPPLRSSRSPSPRCNGTRRRRALSSASRSSSFSPLLGFLLVQPTTPRAVARRRRARRDVSQDLARLRFSTRCPIRRSFSIATAAWSPSIRPPARWRPACGAASRPRSGCAFRNWSTPSPRAVKGKSTERVEFSERIPTERWWEAVVTPVARPATRGRSGTAVSCSRCAISRPCGGSRKCAPISSPMRATNCARRSPRCRASSRR